MVGRSVVASVAVVLLIGMTPGTASAASPPNDNFASAAALSGSSGSVNGTTVAATTEVGEPATCVFACSGGPDHTVWYRWTAPTTNAAFFNTCSNATFNTMLAVYMGSSIGSLARAVDDNDATGCGSGTQSRVAFQAIAGNVYRIQIDGVGAATGTFTLKWKESAALPPANDAFANASPLGGGGTTNGTTLGATTETSEPPTCAMNCSGGPNHTVWYAWGDPSVGATITFDTCSHPAFDTMLAVYSSVDPPSFANLTRVGDSNNVGGCGTGKQSRVRFTNAGGVYYIQVDAFGAATGAFTLTRTIVQPNDAFASARAITGAAGTVAASNSFATAQAGEPATCAVSCSGGPNHTVWFLWTAPKNGTIRFDTCTGTSVDTMLAVYTGSSLGSLTRVADDNDAFACVAGTSRLSFAAFSGTIYRIQVDGVGAAVGSVVLSWLYPPTNDGFSNATTISGASGSINGSNVGATPEPLEPCGANCLGGPGEPGPNETVWYTWTAPRDGTATLGDCATGPHPFVAALAVYTGASPGTLQRVALDDGTQGVTSGCFVTVGFLATSGTRYRVQVDDAHVATGGCPCPPGPFTLSWNVGPQNDLFAGASVLTGTSGTAAGTNVSATRELTEPASCVISCGFPPQGPNHTLWYEWTAPLNATIEFDTCAGTNFATALAAYSEQNGALTRVTDSAGYAGCGTGSQSRVAFPAATGTAYYLQVDSIGNATGSFVLSWTVPPPPNDDFTSAAPISGQFGGAPGNNDSATAEAAEPATCAFTCSDGPTHTVWYSWTAPKSGTATFDVCAASFDTMLAAYTGAAIGSLVRVTDNDDGCGLQSRITFPVTAGTIYRIQVDGWAGDTGTFTLQWSLP